MITTEEAEKRFANFATACSTAEFDWPLDIHGYTSPIPQIEECEACGNTSGLTDMRGNCISCGARLVLVPVTDESEAKRVSYKLAEDEDDGFDLAAEDKKPWYKKIFAR